MSWNAYWASSTGNTLLVVLHVVCVLVGIAVIMKAGSAITKRWPRADAFVGVAGLGASALLGLGVVAGLSGWVGFYGEVRAWHVFEQGTTVVFDASARKVPLFETTLVFVPRGDEGEGHVWRTREAPKGIELGPQDMLHVHQHTGHTVMLDARTFEDQGSLSDILQTRLHGQRFRITQTSTRGVEALTDDKVRHSFTFMELFPDAKSSGGPVRTIAPDHQCKLSTAIPYHLKQSGQMHHVSELRGCGLGGVLMMHRGEDAPQRDVLLSWKPPEAVEPSWTLNLSTHIKQQHEVQVFPLALGPKDTSLRFFVLADGHGLWEGRVSLDGGQLVGFKPLA